LGNIREVWQAAGYFPSETIQRTQYYPSGLPWASNYLDSPSTQPNKYNGKQFDEMHGYDTYDYGARGYYAAMGRFTSVDPLAEKNPEISPYVYCHDNPVNRIDPDGKNDKNGQKTEINKTNGVYISAQSTTGGNEPRVIRSTPFKQSTPMQKALKTSLSKPKGEIKDANKEKYKNTVNEAMNDPVAKQCLTDPVMQTSAVGGLVTMAVVTAPVVTTTVETTAASDVTPLVFKSAQIVLENPQATQYVAGGITGFVLSKVIPMEMQDLPSFSTGLPTFDIANQATQIGMTFKDWYQRDVAPYLNQGSQK
jgi:RHS repeat-associated protein